MEERKSKKLIVLSSPSGGGKSTIARYIMKNYKNIYFSISATTRQKRGRETYGIDYYFISREEFEKRIANGDLIEYEEIYGNYYGTLRSEVEKNLSLGLHILFDIDVKGALSIRKKYPENSLLIFLEPPSIATLIERLKKRKTENAEQIEKRTKRFRMEMEEKNKFDYLILNEKLDETYKKIDKILLYETELKKKRIKTEIK